MLRGSVRARVVFLSLLSAILIGSLPAPAQLTTGYRPVEKPGIYGARIHPGALVPNRRKWYLPQNLYHEYNWRGWEYTNYARDYYRRYVNISQEGNRFYDTFGNYIGRGWQIYDWTEMNPLRQGSSILKGPQFSRWFGNLVISSARHGQFHTALAIGEQIRTTLTPLTFSKPTFNGIQWDFLTDNYAVTLLGSRLNAPSVAALDEGSRGASVENSSRLLSARGVAQVGDFAKLGLTWVNVHNATTNLGLEDNSLKGVLTGPQNLGNVEQVVIRITDDSPETVDSGALLFVDQVLLDGEVHPEIVPLVRGGVQREGILEVSGTDAIELIYDIRNDFKSIGDLGLFSDARKLEFELVVANDYRIEVKSNLTKNELGEEIFLPVTRAHDEITDGSNQRFVRFAYGLPTGNELIGADLEIIDLAGLELRGEYVVNRQYRRFPNQNYRKLPVSRELAEASYLTASYTRYPWFAYGEAYSIDPDYSTTAFISNPAGVINYDNETRHLFEFVDDNDDQDRYADWFRIYQSTASEASSTTGGRDMEVFPGLDENNDFISDFNQNRNAKPDYAEPFLRYTVDAPEFLFGMDMNNNTVIDRFEDDTQADYPYPRDYRGYNLYGGLRLSEDMQLTVGWLKERQLSSARQNRTRYALLTAEWDYPGLRLAAFEHVKWVKDDIPEDRLLWDDAVSNMIEFEDPLEFRDTFVNTTYLMAEYVRIRDLKVTGKLKYERLAQQGDQADDPERRNRSFFGLITKADYTLSVSDQLSFWPRWKSVFERELPTRRSESKVRQLSETFFFTGRYAFLPAMWLDFGLERSYFENLEDRPEEPPPGYADDFSSWVAALLLVNTSDYQGYRLTLNAGVQLERQELKEETRTESMFFLRLFAAISQL